MKNVLVVAAHPDDEALGCGGTMAKHADAGDEVNVIFLADGVSARDSAKTEIELANRNSAASDACKMLGVNKAYTLGFPDNRMDTIALLDIVKEVEKVIDEIRPEVIYTHHAGDLNIDHQIAQQAVMTACRPQPDFCVREIYRFEVLSSTEWSAPDATNVFIPNKFVDISDTIEKKLEALKCYQEEMRNFPHSRSLQSIEALAKYRGASVGKHAAEAFYVSRIIS